MFTMRACFANDDSESGKHDYHSEVSYYYYCTSGVCRTTYYCINIYTTVSQKHNETYDT